MEGFRYVDIFASKGLEYLLVLGFLAVFTFIWITLRRPLASQAQLTRMKTAVEPVLEWFRMRDDAYYHPGHTWAVNTDGQTFRVGIDEFAQKMLGTPEEIRLPSMGTRLRQGDKGWQLSIGDRPIDVLSPISGEVTAINKRLVESPDLVARDPYGEGWLLEVRATNYRADKRNLLTGRFARAWMNESVNAMRDHMVGPVGTVLQDGGEPLPGFVAIAQPDRWDEIAAEFLLTR